LTSPAPLIVTEAIAHLAFVLLVMFIVVPRSGAKTSADVPTTEERLFHCTDDPLKVIVLPFQVHAVVPERIKAPDCVQLLPQVRVAVPVLFCIIIVTEQIHPRDDKESVVPGVSLSDDEPAIVIDEEPSATLPVTINSVSKVRVPV